MFFYKIVPNIKNLSNKFKTDKIKAKNALHDFTSFLNSCDGKKSLRDR